MRPAAAEPTDSTLPAALRGPDGFVRLIQGIGLRISVIGTRGKSTLATMATAALKRRGLAVHSNAPAPPSDPEPSSLATRVLGWAGLESGAGDDFTATRDAIRKDWPVAALVLRNPAEQAAAQRKFHAQVALPHYVLLTNVRRDAHGPLKGGPASAARALARTVTPGATLVSGESDPALKAALRRECERLGVPFVDAAPARLDVPGAEAVSVLDALLVHRFGSGLQAPEEDLLRRELEARFRWASSTIPGVRFFDAGPIHDVDSTQIALNHLQALRRHPVTFVAYFRRDRPGRTRSFAPFLADLLNAPDTRQVFLAGPGSRGVAEGLRRWESQVHVVPDDLASVPRLVRRLQFECQGGAIVTLANGGPEWPRALVAALQKGTPTAPMMRPARPEPTPQSLAPKRIVRPLVAPAPSIPDIGDTFSFARFARTATAPAVVPAGPLAAPLAMALQRTSAPTPEPTAGRP
ncbi:MAG: hypothetical protein ACYC2H_12595 [Thermoplasmatota archaeon]